MILRVGTAFELISISTVVNICAILLLLFAEANSSGGPHGDVGVGNGSCRSDLEDAIFSFHGDVWGNRLTTHSRTRCFHGVDESVKCAAVKCWRS